MTDSPDGLFSALRSAWRRWRAIETAAMWFVLVNFLDAAMTFLLLHRGGVAGGRAVESNPIANHFLSHWGLKGLFAFKLALVVFVCMVCLAISWRDEERARTVFHFGTFVVTGVVLYSVWLYAR
jgi:hypothetical protein